MIFLEKQHWLCESCCHSQCMKVLASDQTGIHLQTVTQILCFSRERPVVLTPLNPVVACTDFLPAGKPREYLKADEAEIAQAAAAAQGRKAV